MKFKEIYRNLFTAFFLTALLLIGTSHARAVCLTGSNLIVNSDAETDAGFAGDGTTDHDLSGWNPESGGFTVVRYTAGGGFPTNSDPGPASRGTFFFAGGPINGVVSGGTQIVNVTDCATQIDAGAQIYDLSGFFGGFASQPDSASVTLTFRNASNASLGTTTIGGVTPGDRGSLTGLVPRSTNGFVPVGTRSIEVVLSMPATSGYNDGYADNLSLILGTAGTWDGGGATNNWSEAANWTGDILPTDSMPVVFDGTSSKNVSFDIPLTRTAATTINGGYTGTLTTGSTNLSFNGGLTVINGNFIGGSGSISVSGLYFQTGGTFNAGSGTFSCSGQFGLNSGTFTQSSNLNLFSTSIFNIFAGGVFNHNNGTFVIETPFSFGGTATSLELFNLDIRANYGFGTRTVIVNNMLTLTGGVSSGGTVEARNDVSIAANYAGTANVLISGNASRTILLPITAIVPTLTINAPNAVVRPAATSGTLTFSNAPLNIQAGTFNANGVSVTFGSVVTQSGGSFIGGTGDLTFNPGGNLSLTGGTFTAPSGLMTYHASNLTLNSAATFVPNGGTFVVGSTTGFLGTATTFSFHNLTIQSTYNIGGKSVQTSGLLNLAGGTAVGFGTFLASGDVSIGASTVLGSNPISFVGSADQTYTQTSAVTSFGIWTVDKPAGRVILATDMDVSFGTAPLLLTNGQIVTGSNTVITGARGIVRSSGYVNGNLRRSITDLGTRQFDVGTDSGYSPVRVFGTAGVFGTTTTFTVGARNGTLSGADPANSLTRHWSLTPSAGGITSANITFFYRQTDVPSGADEASFRFLRNNGSSLASFAPTFQSTAANSADLQNVTQFSDWSLGIAIPTAAGATIAGRARKADGRGIGRAQITIVGQDGNTRTTTTNPFGYFTFSDLASGETYVLSIAHKTFRFANSTQIVPLTESITDIDFLGTGADTAQDVDMRK